MKSKFGIDTSSACHTYKQNTFQIVSIIDTLKMLFENERFAEVYMNNEHRCIPGAMKRFCCGEIYRNFEFFKQNPNAIQIVGIDEFDPCSGLRTIAVVHKMCAIYTQILNLPSKHYIYVLTTF